MPRAGRDAHGVAGLAEPLDKCDGLFRRRRVSKDARVGDDAEETAEDQFAVAVSLRPLRRVAQPIAVASMIRRLLAVGVDPSAYPGLDAEGLGRTWEAAADGRRVTWFVPMAATVTWRLSGTLTVLPLPQNSIFQTSAPSSTVTLDPSPTMESLDTLDPAWIVKALPLPAIPTSPL